MRTLLLILLLTATFAVLHQAVYAQSPENDSLRNNIKTAATDSLRIEALYEYMKANLNNNTSDFEAYIKQMIFLSKKIKFNWGLSTAYILGLSYYKNQGKFEHALQYADSAEAVTKTDTTEDMRLNMGHIHQNRGNLYYVIGDKQKAMSDYVEAVKIFKENQSSVLASALTGIANCFGDLNNEAKAIAYFKEAISTAEAFNDKRLLATTQMNLSTAFMNMNNYAAADSILQIVWPVLEKLQNSKSFIMYYYNKGDIEAYYKKDTLKALEYYRKSYWYAKLIEDVWQQGRSLKSMIDFQLDINHKDTKAYIDTLYRMAKENELSDSESDALDFYSEWYNMTGDYKKAYDYLRQYIAISDSINSEDVKEKITMMEVRFRVEGKEKEIEQLKSVQKIQQLSIRQKTTLNYVLIGSAVALLIILVLGYRNYRNRQKLQQAKIDELETEKQLAATEAVLKGEEQERTRLAKDLHDGLGGMLSGIKFSLSNMKENLIMTPENAQAFERSIDMLDSSIKEMRRVAHNMMPEILVKYGLNKALEEFCNEMDRSGAISVSYQSVGMNNTGIGQTTAVTVYRIVQELVNNAIKHAQAKNLLVQLHQSGQEKLLAITVEDDGKGFDVASLKQSGGMGWRNIENRVEFLKGKLDIQSEAGKGTSVMIEFNI